MTTDTEIETSIDDTMGQVFDDILSRDDDDETEQPDPEQGSDKDTSSDAPDDDPTSDEAAEASETEEGDDTPEGESVNAPEYWSDEVKAKFDALPDDQKSLVLEISKTQQADYTKKTQELAELRQSYEAIDTVNQKWDQYLQSIPDANGNRGVSPDVAFDTMMAAEYTLRMGSSDQKLQALQKLASDYGIEMPSGAAPADGDDDDGYIDPQVASLQKTVENLTNRLSRYEETDKQRQHEQVKQVYDEQASAAKTFADAKDDKGNLKHPHFDEVRKTMGKLIGSGVADNLEDAYQKSLSLVPEVKAKVDAEAKAKADRDAAERAKKAKKSTTAKSKSMASVASNPDESLDDTLERIYDKAQGG